MDRFLPSLLTIGLGLGLGFLIGALFRRFARNPELLPRQRMGLQKLCILVPNPLVFLGAVWVLPIHDGRLAWLPVVGVAAGIPGWLAGDAATPVAERRATYRFSDHLLDDQYPQHRRADRFSPAR